jgi:uncharacterized membrane protein YjdF
MELFVISMAIVGLATTISAIDESIDWVASYHREGEEDHNYRAQQTDSYDRLCDQGHRE